MNDDTHISPYERKNYTSEGAYALAMHELTQVDSKDIATHAYTLEIIIKHLQTKYYDLDSGDDLTDDDLRLIASGLWVRYSSRIG